MLKKRLAAIVGALLLGSLATAAPVLAAAPANDTYAGIQTVTLGFNATVDTTQATTDSNDNLMNGPDCGAPATDASVWYRITGTDTGVLVDLSGSNYSAGAIVATGDPQNGFSLVTCGPEAVAFQGDAGVEYTILVFDDQQDGSGNGGTLQIAVGEAPPPPDVTLTVDPRGTFNSHTGSATIRGTVTCTGSADFSFIDVTARQKVGRLFIDGEGFIEGFACDGTTQAWSTEVFPFNGIFKGGRTISVTFAVACGAVFCGEGFDQSIVMLSARKR
jgi:hypothetical protein